MNLKIVAIGCIITTESDGTESFKYASFPEGEDYLSRAYSLGEAAHNALNERAKGNVAFTESQYQLIEDCANEYVDLVNGLENPTYDDSVFDFSINMGIPGIFQVGKEVDMQVKVSPNADVPITYVSSNTSVAIVDCAGILKTVGAGTATISVYVSGQVKTVTINVA